MPRCLLFSLTPVAEIQACGPMDDSYYKALGQPKIGSLVSMTTYQSTTFQVLNQLLTTDLVQ